MTVKETLQIEFMNLQERLRLFIEDVSQDRSINYKEELKLENPKPAIKFIAKIFRDSLNQTSLIIDFNYTPTISNMLRTIENDFMHPFIKHIKVHGSVNKNIVIGIEDSAEIPSEYNFFKKSHNPRYTSIKKYLLKAKTVEVFGHSLGETDSDHFQEYFSRIVEGKVKSNLIVWYKDDLAYRDLMGEIGKYASVAAIKGTGQLEMKRINDL